MFRMVLLQDKCGYLCCTVLPSPDGLCSDRALRCHSSTHRHLGGEAGLKKKKQKQKSKQPINQKDQKPGIPVLLHSLPLTEDELRVLGRCLCEAVFKATSWCSFTWVRLVSCVPQGLAPTRILQGVKVMAKWKHHLPRCLQHTLPLRAPPGSALLVKCHQKLG